MRNLSTGSLNLGPSAGRLRQGKRCISERLIRCAQYAVGWHYRSPT